jgi:hypothetical protein
MKRCRCGKLKGIFAGEVGAPAQHIPDGLQYELAGLQRGSQDKRRATITPTHFAILMA